MMMLIFMMIHHEFKSSFFFLGGGVVNRYKYIIEFHGVRNLSPCQASTSTIITQRADCSTAGSGLGRDF